MHPNPSTPLPSQSPPLPDLSPLDRPRLTADLDLLSTELSRSILPLLSPNMGKVARAFGINPDRMVADVLSRMLALPDRDLVVLIDALAHELGAIRRRLAPAEMTPELRGAIAALVAALG